MMQSLQDYKKRIIELQKMKNLREAYELLKPALGDYPSDTFLQGSEVYLLMRLGRLKEARQLAEQRVENLRHNTFFIQTYLSILEKTGARDDVDAAVERHVFNVPQKDETLLLFASQLMGRVFGKDRAIDTINRALSLCPGSHGLKELLEKYESGDTPVNKYKQYKETFKAKKPADAIREIESVIVLPAYSNDRELMGVLAELYKKQGGFDKAIALYKRMLALKDDEFTRKMLGFAYYKAGESDDALAYLRESFLKDPNDRYVVSAVAAIFKGKDNFDGLSRLVDETLAAHPDARHLFGLLKRAASWHKKEDA